MYAKAFPNYIYGIKSDLVAKGYQNPVWANGAVWAASYVRNSLELSMRYMCLDGFYHESFGTRWDGSYSSADELRAQIDFLKTALDRGKRVAINGTGFRDRLIPGTVPPIRMTTDQILEQMRYTFGLSLLITDRLHLDFMYEPWEAGGAYRSYFNVPESHLELGIPTAPYSMQGAITTRTFECGTVKVNVGEDAVGDMLGHTARIGPFCSF